MKNANSKQQQADEISLKLTVPEVCKFTSALFPLKAGKRGEGVGPGGKVFSRPSCLLSCPPESLGAGGCQSFFSTGNKTLCRLKISENKNTPY